MSEQELETSTPEEGPASLREALIESFNENIGETSPEDVVTDIIPTDDEPELTASDEQEADDEPSEDLSQGEDEVILAPEHWSDEDKATFTELPSAAQSYLLKRETQYEQGIQSKSEELRPIREAFGDYSEMLKMRGIDEPTAIRTWVAAQSALDADPVNGLNMLIQSYGPEVQQQMREHFGIADEPDDGEYVDPEVKKLREELKTVKRQGQQNQTQYQAALQNEALQQVQSFRNETDDSGKLLRPYFDQAQNTMRALLSSGQVPDLEAAYEQAVWSVPEYRDEFAKQQKADAEQQEVDKRTKAAANAKKVAKTVNGKSSKPPPQKQKATMRDDLVAAWDESVRGEANA